MKKLVAAALALMLVGSTCLTAFAGEDEKISVSENTVLRCGTGGSSGTLYFIGAAIQQGVSESFENLQVASEATAGVVENVRRMNAGDLELGFMGPSTLIEEINAGNVDPENICLLGTIYSNPWYLFGNTSQPTELSADIAGLRMGCGEPGSSLESQATWTLFAAGLTPEDMELNHISMAEQATALVDERIDLAMMGGPVPFSTVEQVAAQTRDKGVHILSWSDEQIEKLQAEDPFINKVVIPADTYAGTDYDVNTVAYWNSLLVRSDVPEDVVYELAKYMWTHGEYLGKIFPVCADIVPENAVYDLDVYADAGIKLHPGAERYFKEIGIID